MPCLSACLPCLSVYLPACMCPCRPFACTVCLHIYLAYLSVLSVRLYAYLSACTAFCLSVYPAVHHGHLQPGVLELQSRPVLLRAVQQSPPVVSLLLPPLPRPGQNSRRMQRTAANRASSATTKKTNVAPPQGEREGAGARRGGGGWGGKGEARTTAVACRHKTHPKR